MLWYIPCWSSWGKQLTFCDATNSFLQNDVWETSAEIPYWWCITTQIGYCFLQAGHGVGIWTFFENFNPFFNTLHRIQKPIGESPRFVSLNIPFLVKGTKKVSFISFIQWLLQMSVIHWSIVLAKIDLVSLYFHLLGYHSVLKGSIDQYSKVHSPLACSCWLPWFPDLFRPYIACVKRGSGET